MAQNQSNIRCTQSELHDGSLITNRCSCNCNWPIQPVFAPDDLIEDRPKQPIPLHDCRGAEELGTTLDYMPSANIPCVRAEILAFYRTTTSASPRGTSLDLSLYTGSGLTDDSGYSTSGYLGTSVYGDYTDRCLSTSPRHSYTPIMHDISLNSELEARDGESGLIYTIMDPTDPIKMSDVLKPSYSSRSHGMPRPCYAVLAGVRGEQKLRPLPCQGGRYMCWLDKKTFADKPGFYRHVKHRHKGKCYSCDICGYIITRLDNMPRHKKSKACIAAKRRSADQIHSHDSYVRWPFQPKQSILHQGPNVQ